MQIDKHHSQSLFILIVDDSVSERALMQAKLQKLGHQSIESSDGTHAIKTFTDNSKKIDLILLDISMPGINGYETAQRIRALEKEREEEWCPIIFLSVKNEPEDIAMAIEAGGDDYLFKPVDTIVLRAKIVAMQRIANMRYRLLETQQKLEKQAHIDELTQLPNRRYFFKMLNNELGLARRHGIPFSVGYMDLDHFKQINDTYGHEAGDDVLRDISTLISDNLRSEDLIGRIGGEEFCFCLPGTDASQTTFPCERYRSLIEELSIQIGTQLIKMTASFGMTTFRPESDDITSLVARADKALFKAKEQGRNRVECI
jgi:two-component system, cell cycle response regulator